MPGFDRTDSMPGGPAVQALVEILRTIVTQAGGSFPRRDRAETLRDSTFAAVDELKRAGLSATDVLFVIETVVARAEVDPSHQTIDALTAWSVQRYFGREHEHPSAGKQ
jgi:hypothetical protein